MKLYDSLKSKDIIHSYSDIKLFNLNKAWIYIGIDLTNNHLHLGHLSILTAIYLFQKQGYNIIIVLGETTTTINQNWNNLNKKKLTKNYKHIEDILIKLKIVKAKILNNKTWLSKIPLSTYLNQIKTNIISNSPKWKNMLNFFYITLQALDFVIIKSLVKAELIQIGGSDQWVNIIAGLELGKEIKNTGMYALTCKLLSTNNTKMSKSGKHTPICIGLNCILKLWIYIIQHQNIDNLITKLSLLTKKELSILIKRKTACKKSFLFKHLIINTFGIERLTKIKKVINTQKTRTYNNINTIKLQTLIWQTNIFKIIKNYQHPNHKKILKQNIYT